MNRTTRVSLWAVLVIGVLLIVIPFAIGLPGKASAGQTMLDDLHPFLQPASVNKTVTYFNNTFVPLGPVSVGAVRAGTEAPKLIGALATPLHTTPAGVSQFLGADFPATANLIGNLPKLTPVFTNVSPGIAHYAPLVHAIQANVGNYAKVDSLPNLRLFTWILVVPGVLLVLLAGWPLVGARRGRIAALPARVA